MPLGHRPKPDATTHVADQPYQRVRYPLQRKLLWWTVLMVFFSTVLCALWLNSIAREVIGQSNARNVELLGQTLAASFAGRLATDGEDERLSPRDLLDTLELDPRLSFVAVTDRENRVLARRVTDTDAYGLFVERCGEEEGLEMDRPTYLGRQEDVVVCKVPILNPPIRDYGSAAFTPQASKLEGFVIIALREYEMPRFLAKLQTHQLMASIVVCLLGVPVIMVAARKLAGPLQLLMSATRRLGAGETPEPVTVNTGDEIAVLADGFNEMAAQLTATQQQLVEANEGLEEKVRVRTAELEQTNQRLQSAMKAKDEFLRAVSHDLGTPLRNIDGMAKMILVKHANELCDDAQKKLERITANVKAQTDLIADLLELSRIRTAERKSELIDVGELLEQLRSQMDFDLQQKGITLQVEGDLPVIAADRNRIRQVFQNLLDNAAKYMKDDGEKRITVGCERLELEMMFWVTDTGPGIAEKDQSLIFHVFRRGTHSGASKAEGRGVGLASVKAIIETYSGNIWVKSELGQGTTFFFTLSRSMVDPLLVKGEAIAPEESDEAEAAETAGDVSAAAGAPAEA